MTNILTRTEFEEIRAESLKVEEFYENKDGFDVIERCSDRFSDDYIQVVQLRSGLYLEINDYKYRNSLNVENCHELVSPIVSKFYLSGNHRVLTPRTDELNEDYVEQACHNYLFYLPDIEEIELTQAGEHIYLIKIHTDINFLRNFSMGFESLPLKLLEIIENDKTQRFHQPLGKITPTMQLSLQQILNCPYQGMTKRMYLEGKTIELLAMQVGQWENLNKQYNSIKRLRPDDSERVHHAKEILIQNWDNPPSLQELTRQVGLNDYKLKQGFRQVFGTSVFGYLQHYRMEQAKQLLAEQELSVRGVAQQIGYASQSHFCYLFKRQFGISPRAYRASFHI